MGFQVTLGNKDIFKCTTRKSSIRYGNPILEWIQAAHWAHYKYFDEFENLPVERQTLIVAAYRTEKQTESALAWRNRPKKLRKR